MKHLASTAFWDLPEHVRALADKNYSLLKENPKHPSLQFKKVGRFWSVRVGARYRARRSTSTKGCCGFGSARMLITMT